MKRDVLINGASAKIQIAESRLRYDREGHRSILADFEMQETEPGSYWVRLGQRSFRVTPSPTGRITVDGRTLTMEVFDPRDLRAASQGKSKDGPQKIQSPMPGKVVRVLVQPGGAVEEGQGVVVVEAMKMQNEMRSPKSGTVREVRTQEGATVGAGEVLLVIE